MTSRKSKYVPCGMIFLLRNWKISVALFATVLPVAGISPAGVVNVPLCVPTAHSPPAVRMTGYEVYSTNVVQGRRPIELTEL